jgi:eukaryotic-like serine/threonine-protein kinase
MSDLNRLLDTALELPSEQRESWLAALDPQFDPLKPRLRDLLLRAARIETRDFLGTLPKLDADPADDVARVAEEPGGCIGPYRLMRELGVGGMGSVWLAERIDGLIKRPVALKLPHVAAKRVGLSERMAREREILATLAHPNIARLYDAGVTAEGRPYLALEYVEGKPIDAYCMEHAVDLRTRLRLFLQVANAVAFAHAKLIIHRDLKPANILVTSEGEVRLLDFGVAKLIDDGQAKATQLTELSGRALTLDYASPEQILAAPLTIATDVYSLGVVLFELLTGTRPYQLRRDSRGALEDAIVQADPPRPSDVAPMSARKALRGDLDTVVLRALKKRPEDRYSTVNAFAEDVLRHLEQRPVLARADSAWYRLRKLIIRRKLAFAALTAVVMAVLVGGGVAVWQARAALAEKARAEEVKSYIASIFRDSDPYRGSASTPTVLDLLRDAESRIDLIDATRADVRVELLALVGASAVSLNDFDMAERVLKKAIAEADGNLPEQHSATLDARLSLLDVHRFRGDTATMRRELDVLLPVIRAASVDRPQDLFHAETKLAHLEIDEGRYTPARVAAQAAAVAAERAFGPNDSRTIGAWGLISVAHIYERNLPEGLVYARRAYEAMKQLRNGDTRHATVIEARSAYARALLSNGHVKESLAEYAGAHADASVVFGPDSQQVGFLSQNIVQAQSRAGLLVAALGSAENALQVLSKFTQKDSFTYFTTLFALGNAHFALRDGENALERYDEAIAAGAATIGVDHRSVINARLKRAQALALLGRHAEARQALDSIPAKERSSIPAAHTEGLLERFAGNHAAALPLQRRYADSLTAENSDERDRVKARADVALSQLALGEAEAANTLRDIYVSLKNLELHRTPVYAEVTVALGRVELERGDDSQACALFREAESAWNELNPRSRWAREAASLRTSCRK